MSVTRALSKTKSGVLLHCDIKSQLSERDLEYWQPYCQTNLQQKDLRFLKYNKNSKKGIACLEFLEDTIYLLELHCKPERKGTGTLMLRSLFELAKNLRFKTITLTCSKQNTAVLFYENFNFRQVKQNMDSIIMQINI